MRIINFTAKSEYEGMELPAEFKVSDELFVFCRTHEVAKLRGRFGFDDSTVVDGADLDESVRYNSFYGYDFVSLVHLELLEMEFLLREINLYVSAGYLVLIIPEHTSPRLAAMEEKVLRFARSLSGRPAKINALYYSVMHHLLVDFADMMEALEDRMQLLSDGIVTSVDQEQFSDINDLRNMAYAVKKQLRALSYLGEQILLDENKLIAKNHIHYFRNINTRMKKLYDFAESLYNFSSEMLYTYDSRLTMKTNDTVNKLAALTLFFGPLTVITGIYGMNFTVMPELEWTLGYPMVLLIMVAVSGMLFYILKKKKWL